MMQLEHDAGAQLEDWCRESAGEAPSPPWSGSQDIASCGAADLRLAPSSAAAVRARAWKRGCAMTISATMAEGCAPEPLSPTLAPRSLTQGELDRILDLHKAWLLRRAGGVQASLRNLDLSCLDLSGRDISDADLGGAVLSGATLVGSRLSRANLFAADLRGANLDHTEFRRADLRGARLDGARLAHALFIEADLRSGMGSANGGAVSQALRTRLIGATLEGARFSRADLSYADLTGCLLVGADFTEAILVGACLRDADLSRANCRYANFRCPEPGMEFGRELG